MRNSFIFVAALFLIDSLSALPLPKHETARMHQDRLYAKPQATQEIYHYEGIVALSNCSGSIVRFQDSEDDDFALVLTNGHCVRLMTADEVLEHESSNRRFSVLDDQANPLGEVQASEVVYATMKKTDMAIYKLKSTYREIRDQFHVEAFQLSRQGPSPGNSIQIISGYWKRGYSCQMEAEIFSVREDVWKWEQSVRYSRPGCEIIGGTSGSPVILEGSRSVVAVNNTSNEEGEECSLNNPCEVDAEGRTTYVKDYGYAQQTLWLYSCLNEKREIDTTVKGCVLPKKS